MPHRVKRRLLEPHMRELGKAACDNPVPLTLITPFRMTLGHKDFFPLRTTFEYDPAANEIYLLPTTEYLRAMEALKEPEMMYTEEYPPPEGA